MGRSTCICGVLCFLPFPFLLFIHTYHIIALSLSLFLTNTSDRRILIGKKNGFLSCRFARLIPKKSVPLFSEILRNSQPFLLSCDSSFPHPPLQTRPNKYVHTLPFTVPNLRQFKKGKCFSHSLSLSSPALVGSGLVSKIIYINKIKRLYLEGIPK